MDRYGNINEHENVLCIECGKPVNSNDDYHIIKRSKKFGSGFIHIHKGCYEMLLPKNKKLRKR